MVPAVQEDVPQRIANLARRSQLVRVVAIGEYRPSAAEHSIDGSCEPGTDGHHAPRQRRAIGRLDDEMEMVRLQRVLSHTKLLALARLSHAVFQLVSHGQTAQRGEARPNAERDVHRVT